MEHQENFNVHTQFGCNFAQITADRFLPHDLPRDLPRDLSRDLPRDLPRDGRFESRDECEVLMDDIKCLQLTEDSFSEVSHIVRENKHLIRDFKKIVDTRTRGTRQEYLNCCNLPFRFKNVNRIQDDEVLKFQVLSQFLFHLNIIPESVAEYRRADVDQVKDDVKTLHKLWYWLCSYNVHCTLQLAAYDDVILLLIKYIDLLVYDSWTNKHFMGSIWIIYKILKVPDIQTQQKLRDVIGDSRNIFENEKNIFALYVFMMLSNDDQIDDITVEDDLMRKVNDYVKKFLKCKERFIMHVHGTYYENLDDSLSTLQILFRNKEIRYAVIEYCYDDENLIDMTLSNWQSHSDWSIKLLTQFADCTLTCLQIEQGLWRIKHMLVADSRTQSVEGIVALGERLADSRSVDGIVALRERVAEYSQKLVPDFFDQRKQIELNTFKTLLVELQIVEPHVVNWLENVKLYSHVCVGYELVVKCILSFKTCPATEVLKCMKELHLYLRYDLPEVYTEMFGEFLTDVKFFEETWRKYSQILKSIGQEHLDDSIDQKENVNKNSKKILFYIRQVWIVTSSYGKLCCDQLITCGVLDEIYFNLKEVEKNSIGQTESFSFTSSLYIMYYLASHTQVSHRGDIKGLLLEKLNGDLSKEARDVIGRCVVLMSESGYNTDFPWCKSSIVLDWLRRDTSFMYLPFISGSRFRNTNRRLDFLRVVHKSGWFSNYNNLEFLLKYIQENWQCTQHVPVILNQLDKLVMTSNNRHTMKKQGLLLTTLQEITAHDDKEGREAAKNLADVIQVIREEKIGIEDEEEDSEDFEDREVDGVKTEREERLTQRMKEIHVPFSTVRYLFISWYKNHIIKSALAILDVTSLSSCSIIDADTVQRIDQIVDNSLASAILLTEFNRWPEMANVALTLVENRNKVPYLVDVDKTIDNVMKLFEQADIKEEIKRNNVLKDLTLRTSKLTCLTVKQTFRFLLFLVKMFDSKVDQQCLSEEELKIVLQNWSSDLSRTNDDLGLAMFVIILMITDVHHGQHLLVYQDTIQELKQRLVTSLHLGQVTFQVYSGENKRRLGICNILFHLQRLRPQERFGTEFPEHCLFHLQSILLQSCWTRQQELELGLQILATYTPEITVYLELFQDQPSLLCSLHACVEFLKYSQFTSQANNATKLLDLIAKSSQAELDPPVERKKTRTENWKDEEKNELLSLIERHKRKIECKERTSECKKKVKQAWDDVTQEHRAKYPSRDLQKVKEQYQRMKSLAKQDMKRAKRNPHGSRLSDFTRRIFDICPEDFKDFKDLFESELNTGDTTEPEQDTDVFDGTNSGSFHPSSNLNSEGHQESTESYNEHNMDDGVTSSNLHVEANFNENQELTQELFYGTDVQPQEEATDRIQNQNIEMEPQPQIEDFAYTEEKRKPHPSTQIRHGCRNLNKRRRFGGDIEELEVDEQKMRLEKHKLWMREKEEKLKQRLEKHDLEIQLKKQKHEQRMREREEKLRMEIERHVLEQRLLEQKLHKEESKGMLTSSHEILDVAGPSYIQL